MREPIERPFSVYDIVANRVRVAVEIAAEFLIVEHRAQTARPVYRVIADQTVDHLVSDRHFVHIIGVPPWLVEAEIRHAADIEVQSLNGELRGVVLDREKGVVGVVVGHDERADGISGLIARNS